MFFRKYQSGPLHFSVTLTGIIRYYIIYSDLIDMDKHYFNRNFVDSWVSLFLYILYMYTYYIYIYMTFKLFFESCPLFAFPLELWHLIYC